MSALDNALRNGHTEVARLLFEAGCSLDSSPVGITTAHMAIMRGNIEFLMLLLERGVRVPFRTGAWCIWHNKRPVLSETVLRVFAWNLDPNFSTFEQLTIDGIHLSGREYIYYLIAASGYTCVLSDFLFMDLQLPALAQRCRLLLVLGAQPTPPLSHLLQMLGQPARLDELRQSTPSVFKQTVAKHLRLMHSAYKQACVRTNWPRYRRPLAEMALGLQELGLPALVLQTIFEQMWSYETPIPMYLSWNAIVCIKHHHNNQMNAAAQAE